MARAGCPRLIGGGKTADHRDPQCAQPHLPGDAADRSRFQPNVDVGLRTTKSSLAHDVCCITDGDADRCGFGDEKGAFINQLRAMACWRCICSMCAASAVPIVKTLSTTSMLDQLGKLYDVPVHETGVGFKYVAPKMMETDAIIGGEESGGYAFRGNVPERDGILANLYLLDLMVQTGKTPSELVKWLFSKVGAHYYDRIDSVINPAQRDAIKAQLATAHPVFAGRHQSHRQEHDRRLQVCA